jgi:flavin-dependent dehydrogenase
MKPRRIAVLALTGVALAAAGGGAIAATQDDPEQSILNDAAKRLNVSPKALEDALKAAEDAQLDKAVKDGKLSQAEADRIKQRRSKDGHVLGGRFGHRGGPAFGRGRFDHGGPGAAIDAAATALGLTRQGLFDQLRSGKSLADVAKAHGKDLADVKAAVRKEIADGLDQAVKDKRLTRDRADEVLRRFDERFDAFAQRSRPNRFGHRGGFGPHHP